MVPSIGLYLLYKILTKWGRNQATSLDASKDGDEHEIIDGDKLLRYEGLIKQEWLWLW